MEDARTLKLLQLKSRLQAIEADTILVRVLPEGNTSRGERYLLRKHDVWETKVEQVVAHLMALTCWAEVRIHPDGNRREYESLAWPGPPGLFGQVVIPKEHDPAENAKKAGIPVDVVARPRDPEPPPPPPTAMELVVILHEPETGEEEDDSEGEAEEEEDDIPRVRGYSRRCAGEIVELLEDAGKRLKTDEFVDRLNHRGPRWSVSTITHTLGDMKRNAELDNTGRGYGLPHWGKEGPCDEE